MRVEDQIAAIGPVQGARGQQVEVGDQGAEARKVFDPADEGLVGRVILVDHRRAALAAIVDQQVDPIAPKARFLDRCRYRRRDRRGTGRVGRRRRRSEKVVGVFLDVRFDSVEVFCDLGQIRIGGSDLSHQMHDREAGGFAAEVAHGIAMLALPLRHLPHDGLEFALGRFDFVLDRLALACREGFEGVGLQHLAVAHRRQRQTHRRAQ